MTEAIRSAVGVREPGAKSPIPSASVGWAVFPENGEDFETLMRSADEHAQTQARRPPAGARPLSGYRPAMMPGLESERLFIGDGGLETTMIFREGFDLPCFASFLLLRREDGIGALRRYYGTDLEIARRHGLGFHPRCSDLAGQPRLGREARLLTRGAG
jgi:hypothetical protein